MNSAANRFLPTLKFLLGLALSFAGAYLALRGVDWGMLAGGLGRASLGWILLALLISILTLLAKAMRWQRLYAPCRALGLGESYARMSLGMLLNIFTPARLGDLARARVQNGDRLPGETAFALGTIVLEKFLDLVMLLLSAVLSLTLTLPLGGRESFPFPEGKGLGVRFVGGKPQLLWLGKPQLLWLGKPQLLWLGKPQLLWLGLGLAILLYLLATRAAPLLSFLERLASHRSLRWLDWALPHLRSALDSLSVLRTPAQLLPILLWTIFIWILGWVTNLFLFYALGLPLDAWAAIFLLVVMTIGVAVPSSPGRVGVFHYLVILSLSVFAIDRSTALLYSLVLYVVVFVPLVLSGAWGLLQQATISNPNVSKSQTLLDFRGSVPLSDPQDFDTIRGQVISTQVNGRNHNDA